jgi:hypothetical protein
MKLYDVPNGSMIRVVADAQIPPDHREVSNGEVVKFLRIDGMYSLCIDSGGVAVHLAAWTDVEIV